MKTSDECYPAGIDNDGASLVAFVAVHKSQARSLMEEIWGITDREACGQASNEHVGHEFYSEQVNNYVLMKAKLPLVEACDLQFA